MGVMEGVWEGRVDVAVDVGFDVAVGVGVDGKNHSTLYLGYRDTWFLDERLIIVD